MAKARLTEYLLKLATDSEALEKHRKGSEKERVALMEAAGLSVTQRQAVLSGDSQRITEEVVKELGVEHLAGSGIYVQHPPGGGIYVQIHVQLEPQQDQ